MSEYLFQQREKPKNETKREGERRQKSNYRRKWWKRLDCEWIIDQINDTQRTWNISKRIERVFDLKNVTTFCWRDLPLEIWTSECQKEKKREWEKERMTEVWNSVQMTQQNKLTRRYRVWKYLSRLWWLTLEGCFIQYHNLPKELWAWQERIEDPIWLPGYAWSLN